MQLFKSMEKIWWNKGNEVKPTKSDFNRIQWQEVPNFNINWIDEMTISLVCGLQDTFDLIKVVNNANEEVYDKVRYYYLVGIENKTAVNKECIFELDLWTTFILEDQNKLFNFPTYSAAIGVGNTNSSAIVRNDKLWTPLVKFTAANIPKKDYIVKPIQWLARPSADPLDAYKVGDTGFITLTSIGRDTDHLEIKGAGFLASPVRNDSYISGCIYYIFKLQGGNYFVAPLLYSKGNVNIQIPYIKDKMDMFGTKIEDRALLECENTSTGLSTLVENYSTIEVPNIKNENGSFLNEWLQLGELVGVYYGPHNNRIKSRLCFTKAKGFSDYFNMSYDVKVKGPDGNMSAPLKFYYTTKSSAYAGYIMSTDGLEVLGFRDYAEFYSYDYLDAVKKNLNICASDQLNILCLKGKLFFTNMLVYVAEGQVVELNTEVPYYIDSYIVKLNNQMNAYNTGYFWNQFNTAKNGVLDVASGAIGLYSPARTTTNVSNVDGFKERSFAPYKTSTTKTGTGSRKYRWSKPQTIREAYGKTRTNISTMAGHFNPSAIAQVPIAAINTGLQLANNYAMRKAELDDMRATLSTVNTTTNSRCLQAILILSTTYHKDFDSYHIFDYAVGYDAEVIDEWYRLYGYEVNFYNINGSLKNVPDNTFVKTPDILKLKYLANNILPPTIRDALWEMLVNGVLVVTKELATSGGY